VATSTKVTIFAQSDLPIALMLPTKLDSAILAIKPTHMYQQLTFAFAAQGCSRIRQLGCVRHVLRIALGVMMELPHAQVAPQHSLSRELSVHATQQQLTKLS
jgi:hypothetical protein